MADITVQEQVADEDGWIFDVHVKEGDEETRHSVSLTREYHKKLAGERGIAPAELVETSFQFLLAHEPKESILPSFALREIQKYFPDFEKSVFKM